MPQKGTTMTTLNLYQTATAQQKKIDAAKKASNYKHTLQIFEHMGKWYQLFNTDRGVECWHQTGYNLGEYCLTLK